MEQWSGLQKAIDERKDEYRNLNFKFLQEDAKNYKNKNKVILNIFVGLKLSFLV